MKIQGLITALVTPFDQENIIDISATEKLINRLIKDGVDGIFILGTNGEFHVMNNEEKLYFAKEVVRIVNHRVPVYAGAGAVSTYETVELSKQMENSGVDALSIITPYFMKLNDQELYNHFKTVANSVAIPVLLYNIPKVAGNSLSPEVVEKLASIKNIKGIKDSSGDIKNIEAYISKTKDNNFSVLSGSDSLILKALQAGATGAVAATSNSITKTDVAIFRYFQKGDLVKAQEMQNNIEEFRRIQKYATVPSVLKYALSVIGNPVGKARKPVEEVPEEFIDEIKKVMRNYIEQESKL